MPTLLPTDANNQTIPAMRLQQGGAHAITATTTSARNTTAFKANTRVVSIYATVPVFIRFGTSTVTATTTDHYFPAGVYYDVAIASADDENYGYLAVLRTDTNGTVYISEKE